VVLDAWRGGYATPKLDVRGVVFRENGILLVKEREDGGWTLPGGWADVGESPADATVREVREESGFETRAVKLLAVYDRNRHGHTPIPFHAYKLFFRCEIIGGAPATSVETEGVDCFGEDSLPPLSISRVTPAQIHRFFEHLRNPGWPTEFD
jgi:ADP-ribose pyrophosphatase YjhB (NUDIX family)